MANLILLGRKSMVFSPQAHALRLQIRNWTSPMDPNVSVFCQRPPLSLTFNEQTKRSHVHLYASERDVLALCEILRLGADPDLEDSDGMTPLYTALDSMLPFFLPGSRFVHDDTGKPFTPAETKNELDLLVWVVRILVEQHVNVNKTVGDFSLLYMAYLMRNWEIVSLLLEHGAKMTLTDSEIQEYFSPDEQLRLLTLVKSQSNSVRPPRMCPCWSGETLLQCHAMKRPYPAKFICICGSNKIYERCCLRKRPVVEKWGDEHGKIVSYYEHPVSVVSDIVPPKYDEAERYERHRELALTLLAKGEIDPAFAYALQRTVYEPLFSGQAHCRRIREDVQRIWNDLIDEYIEAGVDERPVFEIEKNAKISLSAGALYKTCEGEECTKVEKRDVDALKKCACCRIAVYCCHACQKSAWPKHKLICGSQYQGPQMSASQKCPHFLKNLRRQNDKLKDASVICRR